MSTPNTVKIKIDMPSKLPNSDADLGGALGMYTNTLYSGNQSIKVPRGADGGLMGSSSGPRSIFNDYHVLYINKGNYPIFDKDYKSINDKIKAYTALDLINNPQGASIFMPRDFMLCARYGMPINRMITLRRFPYPVGDNIFEKTKAEYSSSPVRGGATEPDVGRMVTYMDQEINKMSEILKFAYKLNWRELNATTEDASGSMNGDAAGVSGWMKSMAELMDDGTLSTNHVKGANLLAMNPLNDQNKVHGPVDSIAKTMIREIGLDNDISFTITFDYELKSINGMNPKVLFMDLLSNILAVTFNNGRFWGGARIWTGERPSNWMRKLAFFNPQSAEDFLNRGRVAFKESLKPFMKPGGKQAALDVLKGIVMNGLNLALGKILDKVGRPSTIVMNSLLNADPTGEWHLTIGNPLNPIISMGNLILENTELNFGDELGYDDFPTKIQVVCTLKPGQPRDKAGLESIFNKGMGRTYWAPTNILKSTDDITDFKDISSGYLKYGMDKITMQKFGEFDEASVSRAADMQTEYLRQDAKSSEKPSVTSSQASTSFAKSQQQQRYNNNTAIDQKPISATAAIPENNRGLDKNIKLKPM